MSREFVNKVLKNGEKQSYTELKELIMKTPQKVILETIRTTMKTEGGVNFWNYILKGFALCNNIDDNNHRRFECVEMFLQELNKIDLPYKQSYDLITRLCSDLICFQNNHLLTFVDICFDSMKKDNVKSAWWKDIFPELISILCNQAYLDVNGVKLNGSEYRQQILKTLLLMKWHPSNLTALASMIVEIKLNDADIVLLLVKFCKCLLKINPSELPPLAYQLFCISQSPSQLIIIIIGLEKYFHRFYYKKLFTDLESDTSSLDSIDKFSTKDIREAEETILHHLNFCTRFKISEEQICTVLRNLTSSPELILTPFFLSAIISMSQANRDPDCWILTSPLLLFLRNVIQKNEDQRELSKNSVWCQDTLQTRYKNMDQIFGILIDQNKEGKDVITPGLVNLAFVLLKTKNNPKLNQLSIAFLAQFVKKRFVFGYGVLKNLTDWMIAEQDAEQYSDCLTVLSHSDTLTFSESFKIVKNVLDFFLWIPGKNAMRMLSFILPVVKISQPIRDAFIDVMKKAINSRNMETCHLGVFGFCSLLKQLTNNNSQRSTSFGGGSFMHTQQCISGYSLMSQTILSNRSNPQKHFDVLVLEIVGCLRKCFGAALEVKETLYENLGRAVLLNSKLAPHILEFVDNHFRSYFKVNESETIIHWDKIVSQNGDNVQVNENLGQLTILISLVVLVCEKNEAVLNSDVIKTIIKTVAERIISKDYRLIDSLENTDNRKHFIAFQQLNFLESLFYYLIWTSKPISDNIKKIHELFEEYQKIKKIFEESIKANKKNKDKDSSEKNETVRSKAKITFKTKNILDFLTLERFLRLIHDDIVPFASPTNAAFLKNNINFNHFILETINKNLEDLQNEPKYKQIKLSTRLFKQICIVTRVIYERCIKNLSKLWTNFDVKVAFLAVECLKQSFITIKKVYETKFDDFLKEIDLKFANTEQNIYLILQKTFEEAFKAQEDDGGVFDGNKILESLLESLEVLYSIIPASTSLALNSFDWVFQFCQNNEINQNLSIIYKILFSMRIKTRTGLFFETIASHIGKKMGHINEENVEIEEPKFDFKSITDTSANSCYTIMINSLRIKLEDIDFFISKIKSSFFNLKFVFEDDKEICNLNLKTIESSICKEYIHLCNCLIEMTNIDVPLGESMNNLIRFLIQFYVSLNNFTKHLMLRISNLPVSFFNIKYDQVVRLAGRPLASNIYALIINIDEKIVNSLERSKKSNPSADRAKVLKETKFLPKLILRMENFNKYVMLLSKKSKHDLTHFLHIGTVRDFRIQTKNLKEAIDISLSHSSQIDDEVSLENNEELDVEIENIDDENDDTESLNLNIENQETEEDSEQTKIIEVPKQKNKKPNTDNKKKPTTENKNKTKPKAKVAPRIKNVLKTVTNDSVIDVDNLGETPAMSNLDEEEIGENAGLKFLENVAKLTKKTQKRKMASGDNAAEVEKKKVKVTNKKR